jgi:hypothetical protein
VNWQLREPKELLDNLSDEVSQAQAELAKAIRRAGPLL